MCFHPAHPGLPSIWTYTVNKNTGYAWKAATSSAQEHLHVDGQQERGQPPEQPLSDCFYPDEFLGASSCHASHLKVHSSVAFPRKLKEKVMLSVEKSQDRNCKKKRSEDYKGRLMFFDTNFFTWVIQSEASGRLERFSGLFDGSLHINTLFMNGRGIYDVHRAGRILVIYKTKNKLQHFLSFPPVSR